MSNNQNKVVGYMPRNIAPEVFASMLAINGAANTACAQAAGTPMISMSKTEQQCWLQNFKPANDTQRTAISELLKQYA